MCVWTPNVSFRILCPFRPRILPDIFTIEPGTLHSYDSCFCRHVENQPRPVLGSPISLLGMKLKQETSAIWSSLKIGLGLAISMKKSRWELSIDMVVDGYILKNHRIDLTLCVT